MTIRELLARAAAQAEPVLLALAIAAILAFTLYAGLGRFGPGPVTGGTP